MDALTNKDWLLYGQMGLMFMMGRCANWFCGSVKNWKTEWPLNCSMCGQSTELDLHFAWKTTVRFFPVNWLEWASLKCCYFNFLPFELCFHIWTFTNWGDYNCTIMRLPVGSFVWILIFKVDSWFWCKSRKLKNSLILLRTYAIYVLCIIHNCLSSMCARARVFCNYLNLKSQKTICLGNTTEIIFFGSSIYSEDFGFRHESSCFGGWSFFSCSA